MCGYVCVWMFAGYGLVIDRMSTSTNLWLLTVFNLLSGKRKKALKKKSSGRQPLLGSLTVVNSVFETNYFIAGSKLLIKHEVL